MHIMCLAWCIVHSISAQKVLDPLSLHFDPSILWRVLKLEIISGVINPEITHQLVHVFV